jgi:UDP-glucose 4-epimerase
LKLLVTGGAGYIGTHSIIELLNAGHDISVIDDLSNSHIAALQRVRKLTKRDLAFMQADLCDTAAVSAELQRFRPDGVIHFAGLKAVRASVARPLDYYRKNVGGTLSCWQGWSELAATKLSFPHHPQSMVCHNTCPMTNSTRQNQ